MIWTTRPRSEGAGALTYFAEGDGAALVLIHGVGLRAEAWSGVVPMLTQRFRVICVDMPGHGEAMLGDTIGLDGFAGRLAAFVSDIPGPVSLGGHSMGALLAVELACRLPEKVRGIAALNTIYRRTPEAAAAVRARADALASQGPADPEPTLARWFGPAPTGAAMAAAEACRVWLTMGNPQGYAAAYRVFAEEDGPSDRTLERLACPAFYLTGTADPNSTPAMSEALAQVSPTGRWDAIEGAAHMLPMTHPETVVDRLLAHFDRT